MDADDSTQLTPCPPAPCLPTPCPPVPCRLTAADALLAAHGRPPATRQVRRGALLALNCVSHNKPAAVRDALPELLPMLYEQTKKRPELVHQALATLATLLAADSPLTCCAPAPAPGDLLATFLSAAHLLRTCQEARASQCTRRAMHSARRPHACLTGDGGWPRTRCACLLCTSVELAAHAPRACCARTAS